MAETIGEKLERLEREANAANEAWLAELNRVDNLGEDEPSVHKTMQAVVKELEEHFNKDSDAETKVEEDTGGGETEEETP